MSLDDIWNEPIASPPKFAPVNLDSSPIKRPRHPLFFSDSDSDNERPPKRPTPAPPSTRPDVDALFEDFDKDEEDKDLRYKPLAPALDLAKLAQEAEARHARNPSTTQTASSQSGSKTGAGHMFGKTGEKDKLVDGEKPGRKVLPKLDEERLVGPDGFPSLIEEIRGFKPKGKGNEHVDLNRLLQVYQFWSHKMYPKMSFKDTVNRVEKLCHTKRMQVRLSVWRDEFKGITNDTKADDDPDVIDLTEPTPIATEDEGAGKENTEPVPRILSPTASSENGANANTMNVDDDASLWDTLDDPGILMEPPQSTPPSSALGGDDEEMWNIVDEMEQMAKSIPAETQIQIPISGVNVIPSLDHTESENAPRPTNDDDWDEMYS